MPLHHLNNHRWGAGAQFRRHPTNPSEKNLLMVASRFVDEPDKRYTVTHLTRT